MIPHLPILEGTTNWPSTILHPLIGVIYQHKTHPEITGHVVEVRSYFDTNMSPRLKIYTNDGKVFDDCYLNFAWADCDDGLDTVYLDYHTFMQCIIYSEEK
ncbi:hypothetical protein Acj133p082 [Acinetobacter phage 133]|uniref:Uncharacterized protein n=1 Tax=Acinetobacter phage 133 TaxID=2919552 RepID=Q6J2P2_9CAUD|nr:hypothetical protein Acj133p082 [Acinetobacter phage 133]AAT38491.1 hypothetical protein Acj133p082 [Acinetobacter phage 133]